MLGRRFTAQPPASQCVAKRVKERDKGKKSKTRFPPPPHPSKNDPPPKT